MVLAETSSPLRSTDNRDSFVRTGAASLDPTDLMWQDSISTIHRKDHQARARPAAGQRRTAAGRPPGRMEPTPGRHSARDWRQSRTTGQLGIGRPPEPGS